MNSWEQFVNENAKELERSAIERKKKENSAAAQRELFFQFFRKDGENIRYIVYRQSRICGRGLQLRIANQNRSLGGKLNRLCKG